MLMCNQCNLTKQKDEFYKQVGTKTGYTAKCRDCTRENDQAMKRTIRGVTATMYGGQKAGSKRRKHDAPLYTSEELHDRCINNPKFTKLFTEWELSGYKKNLKPSIDRLDDNKGYSFTNIQVLTWQENNDKGNKSKERKVVCYTKEGKKVNTFKSILTASKEMNISNTSIHLCCKGVTNTAGKHLWEYVT